MKEERVERFERLVEEGERWKRETQYT